MIKYLAAATALKLFSITPQMKSGYRLIGNNLGQRERMHHKVGYKDFEFVKKLLNWCEQYGAIRPGDRLLEVGTGWLHWASTVIRLFYDVEITMFDVWDNRGLQAYKYLCAQLEKAIDTEFDLGAAQFERIHDLLREIATSTSFDDVYDRLGFHYVINPGGVLTQLPDQSFSLIFSQNVLEPTFRSFSQKNYRFFHRAVPKALRPVDGPTPDAARW